MLASVVQSLAVTLLAGEDALTWAESRVQSFLHNRWYDWHCTGFLCCRSQLEDKRWQHSGLIAGNNKAVYILLPTDINSQILAFEQNRDFNSVKSDPNCCLMRLFVFTPPMTISTTGFQMVENLRDYLLFRTLFILISLYVLLIIRLRAIKKSFGFAIT